MVKLVPNRFSLFFIFLKAVRIERERGFVNLKYYQILKSIILPTRLVNSSFDLYDLALLRSWVEIGKGIFYASYFYFFFRVVFSVNFWKFFMSFSGLISLKSDRSLLKSQVWWVTLHNRSALKDFQGA